MWTKLLSKQSLDARRAGYEVVIEVSLGRE